MEMGRTCRACVMATAVLKDADGTEQTVSFSSVQQNEQIVAVIEPGRLGVETDCPSLTVEPGKTVTLPVRIKRGKGLTGSAKVEAIIAPHLHGISAATMDVAADQHSGELAIHGAADAHGPFNAPLVIRVTILDKGEPVIGEATVQIQARR
jgi:hypothetical protein